MHFSHFYYLLSHFLYLITFEEEMVNQFMVISRFLADLSAFLLVRSSTSAKK